MKVLLRAVFIMEAMESFNKNYRNNDSGVGVDSHDNSEQSEAHSTISQPQEIQEKLTGQINHAISGTSEKLSQLAEKIESTGSDSSTSFGQTAHKVAEQVRRSADTLQSTSAEQLGEQLQQTIRERPLTSISIAFGVGFVLSQLLKR